LEGDALSTPGHAGACPSNYRTPAERHRACVLADFRAPLFIPTLAPPI
jgi:hypothetical protein